MTECLLATTPGEIKVSIFFSWKTFISNMSEFSVKRNCLYGPKRENANTVKDFLVKDYVLPKDDCNVKKTWETTSDVCFGKKVGSYCTLLCLLLFFA